MARVLVAMAMVTKFQVSEAKFAKDLQSPTLNTIQPRSEDGDEQSFAGTQRDVRRINMCTTFPEGEELRLANSQAMKRAYMIHQQIHNLKDQYVKDAATFFHEGQPKASSDRRQVVGKHRGNSSNLRVGTDCSGTEAPIQALHNLHVDHTHVFSCDNDPNVVRTIKANFLPTTIYDNITTRDNDQCAEVDLYIAGFPCQPFSTAGKQQGFEDEKGRGTIFYNVLQYIEKHKPKVFILENVKGLVTLQKGKYLRKILKALHSIKQDISSSSNACGAIPCGAYEIHHTVLNTKDQGVPQNRPRWYCVGIRKDTFGTDNGSTFEFPRAIPCPSIELFLDDRKGPKDLPHEETFTARRNIDKARNAVRASGQDPDMLPYVIDCDASQAKTKHIHDLSPCITRSRHNGHWLTHKNRRMTKEEMFRLQGMNPTQFTVDVAERTLGQQIGNAMSVNVIERVILRALIAAKLMPGESQGGDRWESGEALDEL